MATHNNIYSEIPTKEIYTLLEYTFKKATKPKVLNIGII